METNTAREVSDRADAQRDEYSVVREIGKGTFGIAYLVKNKVEGKLYVLKKIRLARQSERQREASLREMRLLADLDHPNILRYKEAWLEKGCVVCIVTSYCDGGDLMSLLQRSRGRYFREEILHEWFVQAALALAHIHKRRVLHRDIKSGNILLHNGVLQLADFGLARELREGENFSKTQVGTPNYMCPELLQDMPYNHKSDVWSLGCVMYELTALRPAFQAFNINGLVSKIIKGSLAPMPSDYSPEWRSLVRAMLHKNPSERPELEDLLSWDFLKDTVQAVKERITQENAENPRDAADITPPPNITPQDLKKILHQRQEKDYAARVHKDTRERSARTDRRNRGVSGRVGAEGGRFGANGVPTLSRQPSAKMEGGGDVGGDHTPLVRRTGVGTARLDPLGDIAELAGGAGGMSFHEGSSNHQRRIYSGRGGKAVEKTSGVRLPPMCKARSGGDGGGGGSGGDLGCISGAVGNGGASTTGRGPGGVRVLPPPLTPLDIAAAPAKPMGDAELGVSLRRPVASTTAAATGRAGLSSGGVLSGRMSPRHIPSGAERALPSLRRTGGLHATGHSHRGGAGETVGSGIAVRKMEAQVRGARYDSIVGSGAFNDVHPTIDLDTGDDSAGGGTRVAGRGERRKYALKEAGTGGVVRLPHI